MRPVRKRGFYRALAKKQTWAVAEQCFVDIKNQIVKQMYQNILKPNPFLEIVKQEDKINLDNKQNIK